MALRTPSFFPPAPHDHGAWHFCSMLSVPWSEENVCVPRSLGQEVLPRAPWHLFMPSSSLSHVTQQPRGQFMQAKQWARAAGEEIQGQAPNPSLDLLCWLKGSVCFAWKGGEGDKDLPPLLKLCKRLWGPIPARKEPVEPCPGLFLESDQVPSTQLSFPPVGRITVLQYLFRSLPVLQESSAAA